MEQLSNSTRQRTHHPADAKSAGFALTSCLVVIPLWVTVLIALGAAFFTFKKKSAAQSWCVQQAVRLQKELSEPLQKLVRMNPRSAQLRRQRDRADRAVQTAMRSGNPKAIAAAKAYQIAVILDQLQHSARQQALLGSAENLRLRHARELRQMTLRLKARNFRTQRYFAAALAVRPAPTGSLTPDYVPAEPFAELQQQRFGFDVDLSPPFALWKVSNLKQRTECSATLKQEDQQWNVQILAASARSN